MPRIRSVGDVRGVRHPFHAHLAGARQVEWHTVPERVLTVRLDGSAKEQTSVEDVRLVAAGGLVLIEDVEGKGHKSLYSPEEQTVLGSLPQGLDAG